jgi:hypothetical protein
MFYQFGHTTSHVCQRVALATLMFNCPSPGARMHALLTALRYHSEHFSEYHRPEDLDEEELPSDEDSGKDSGPDDEPTAAL